MSVTLGEVLNMSVLRDAKLVTNTFDPRTTVENITIMEAPDIARWVDGNNILLTGLYAIWDDEAKMAELVSGLYSGNICAIFVKTGRFVEQVPQSIIDAGNELGIAVAAIPSSVRYIDIMYPVIAEIFDSQVIKLSYFKQTLNSLSSLALSNKGIKSVATLFSEIISNPVIIYDSDLRPIYATDPRFRESAAHEAERECEHGDQRYRLMSTSFPGLEGSWPHLFFPVCVFGKAKIYISVIEWNHAMTEMDFIAVENVLTVFGFEMMKDYAEEEAARQFQNQLIDDIRRGRNLDSLKDRLRSIRLNAAARYGVMIVEMPPRPINTTPAIVNQQMVDDSTVKAGELFAACKRSLGLSGFEAQRPEGIVAALAQPADDEEEARRVLAEFCRGYLSSIREALPGFHVSIGYSSVFHDITHTQELYQSAKFATHIGRLLYGENAFCDYEQLGVLKLLGLAKDREDLSRFVPVSVRRLWEHEHKNGPGLVETLECYLRHNCNVQQTAKALFIHYKTLYYRLGKIRTIMGVDLKDSGQVLEMRMGLVVARLLEEKNHGANPRQSR